MNQIFSVGLILMAAVLAGHLAQLVRAVITYLPWCANSLVSASFRHRHLPWD
jgi:hypothetical protein